MNRLDHFLAYFMNFAYGGYKKYTQDQSHVMTKKQIQDGRILSAIVFAILFPLALSFSYILFFSFILIMVLAFVSTNKSYKIRFNKKIN